jgi:hypothetical protein
MGRASLKEPREVYSACGRAARKSGNMRKVPSRKMYVVDLEPAGVSFDWEGFPIRILKARRTVEDRMGGEMWRIVAIRRDIVHQTVRAALLPLLLPPL